MASVVWMGVFLLLMIELFITALLVLPLPRVIRKFIARKIFNYNLAKNIRFISNFIVLALILAVSDAISTLRHLEQKEEKHESGSAYPDARNGYVTMNFDKQRKFRAERNMYLAGFALTLVFVIARLVELMQETVNSEEEKEDLKRRIQDIHDAASNSTSQVTDISAPKTESPLVKRANAANGVKTD